jgi:hypothetical protein
MEDTAAEPTHLAVIDDIRVLDYPATIYDMNKAADKAVRSVTEISITNVRNDVNGCSLIFDGHSTILSYTVNNNDVLMWSVNGLFSGRLQLLPHHRNNYVDSLAIDSANHTMYVGYYFYDLVSVFKLTYGQSSVDLFTSLLGELCLIDVMRYIKMCVYQK